MQSFDNASGGPWGSAVLLCEIKGRVAWLASAGASLTILLLAFEPFTQQVIQFEPRNRKMTYLGRESRMIDFGAIGRPRDPRAHGAVDVERYSAVGHGLVSAMAV